MIPPRLVPPADVLMSIYGPSPAIELSPKRRLELGTACVFLDHYDEERNAWFQIPAEQIGEDNRDDAFGIDVIARTDTGDELKLQVKGIHIDRAIQRWKQGISVATEEAFGGDAVTRQQEDEQQLRAIFRDEILKLKHKDYGDSIVLFYTDSESTPQAALEELIAANIDDIRAVRAREVWFIQDIPTAQAADRPTRGGCTVYKLLKAAPDRATHFYHLRYAE